MIRKVLYLSLISKFVFLGNSVDCIMENLTELDIIVCCLKLKHSVCSVKLFEWMIIMENLSWVSGKWNNGTLYIHNNRYHCCFSEDLYSGLKTLCSIVKISYREKAICFSWMPKSFSRKKLWKPTNRVFDTDGNPFTCRIRTITFSVHNCHNNIFGHLELLSGLITRNSI